MKALLEATAARAARYLEDMRSRRVAPDPTAISGLLALDRPMPDDGINPELVLAELDEIGSPATTAMAGPRFFGFVIGGALPAALAANWLSTAWDQNTTHFEAAPAAAALEQIALAWLVDLLRLPSTSSGAFVTGTTMANFTALAAARHAVLAKAGWNVEADGLFGAPPITVMVSDEAHPTIPKSLGMLGLGRNRVVSLPVDGQGRISACSIPRIAQPTIVCVQAGNINTGAFDPIQEVCERVHESGGWVHVDGAFGLWARVAQSRAHLTLGIEDADSWATDAHKWLNVPYDNGIVLVRDPAFLRAAMSITAEYLPAMAEFRNPSDYTPELSRRARGVDVWAALRSLGRNGIAALIERTCLYAERFADAFSAAGYEVLNDVVLNQVLVSFGTAEITEQVIAEVQKDGTCWCGGTIWQGRTAMRISLVSWLTRDIDVELSIKAILRVAAKYHAADQSSQDTVCRA